MAKCPFNKYKECQESDSRYCYCTLPCDVYNNYKKKLLTYAYLGKTYVNQGYPIRRTFQIQFELPDKIKNNYLK